jgi:leucyl aminopeptidase
MNYLVVEKTKAEKEEKKQEEIPKTSEVKAEEIPKTSELKAEEAKTEAIAEQPKEENKVKLILCNSKFNLNRKLKQMNQKPKENLKKEKKEETKNKINLFNIYLIIIY